MRIWKETKKKILATVAILLACILFIVTCWLTNTILKVNRNYNEELLKSYTAKV